MDAYQDAATVDLDSDVAAVAASSLLRCFPPEDSRNVLLTLFKSVSVIRPGTNEVVITIGGKEATMALSSVGSTEFFIQLLTYGLSLSVADYETLAKCVAICTEWVAAIIIERYSQLPAPIVSRHEFYLDLLLKMLVELFRLRDTSKQPLLCHLVLRRIEETAKENISSIRRDVWQKILTFALRTSNIVFQSVGSCLPEFSHRAASVLIHLWLAACVSCFPPPPLWKTLAQLLPKWRHSQPVVEQWGVAVVWLTHLLAQTCFQDRNFQNFAVVNNNNQQCQHWTYLHQSFLDNPNVLSQSWFRILYAAGKVLDLVKPASFLTSTLPTSVPSPTQPSQEQLTSFIKAVPAIYHSSVYSLCCVSDLLLGIQCTTVPASQLSLINQSQTILDLSLYEGNQNTDVGSSGTSQGSSQSSQQNPRKSSRKVLTQKVVGRPVSMAGLMGSLAHSTSSTSSTVVPLSTPTQPVSQPIPIQTQSSIQQQTSLPNSISCQNVAMSSSSASSTTPISQSQSSIITSPLTASALSTTASALALSTSSTSSLNSNQLLPPQILVQIANANHVRPAVSTLLNLVGEWLMDAIYIVVSVNANSKSQNRNDQQKPRSGSAVELEASVQQAIANVTMTSDSQQQMLRLFSTGTAEALGGICRLVGSLRRWGPVAEMSQKMKLIYFARFQQILGLALNTNHPHLVGSIILNASWSLFHGQLPGVTYLVPDIVSGCRLSLKTNLQQEQRIVHACYAITCSLIALPGSSSQVVVENLFDALAQALFPQTGTGQHQHHEEANSTPVSPQTYALETLQLQLTTLLLVLISNTINAHGSPIDEQSKSPIQLFSKVSPAICKLLIATTNNKSGASRDTAVQGRQLCALEMLSACAPWLAKAASESENSSASGNQLAFVVMVALCQMIEAECSRPPTEHSRDLHSVIVAAYNCLAIWVANCGAGFHSSSRSGTFTSSPNHATAPTTPLVACRDFFARVMRVIELGLTGTVSSVEPSFSSTDMVKSSSSGSANQALTPTTPVAILPVSRRVQLSAETLLHVVLSSPPLKEICRPFATSCCVDENLLRKHISGESAKGHTYCLGGDVVATFLPTKETHSPQQLNNGVMMLVRNPHGRFCWLLNKRPMSTPQANSPHPSITLSPESCKNQSASLSPGSYQKLNSVKRRFQPPGIDYVTTVQADFNLPRNLTGRLIDPKMDQLKQLVQKCEQRTNLKVSQMPKTKPAEPPKPPTPLDQHQSLFLDRLLLNHLAYTKPTANQRSARFAMLDVETNTKSPPLSNLIDTLGDRLQATLWCFYHCQNDESNEFLIPSMKDHCKISPLLWEMLESVAWPRPCSQNSVMTPPYDGSVDNAVLYWADSAMELTVLCPNLQNFAMDSSLKHHHHNPTAVLCFLEDPDADRDCVMKKLNNTMEKLYQQSGGVPIMFPFVILASFTGTGAVRFQHPSPGNNSCNNIIVSHQSSGGKQHFATSIMMAATSVAPGGLVMSRKVAPQFLRQAVIAQAMRSHLVLSAAAPTTASVEGTTPASRRQQRIEAFRRATMVDISEPDLFASLLVGKPPTKLQQQQQQQQQQQSHADTTGQSSNQNSSRFSAGLILAGGAS